MAESAQAQAAASRTAAAPASPIQITPLSGRTVLRLKSWLAESLDDGEPVGRAGQTLPLEVGATAYEPLRVLCLGPGDWLVVSSEQPAPRLREHLEPYLALPGLAIVDLTDGLASLKVCGPTAREVLSKGCGLDLHPRRFPAGRCARTRFAQVPVVMECLDDPPRFELTVARSYFRYLHEWITDATTEFKGSPT